MPLSSTLGGPNWRDLMKWLITSDIHLSDRPRDSYRFGLFKWLVQQQRQHNTTPTFILGDLTHEKDNHSSLLVNRAIDEMTQLKPPVYILRGNHDGIDPNNPYFGFLSCIDGFEFVGIPTARNFGVSLIPHYRRQADFDEALEGVNPGCAIMVHQT